MSCPAVIGGIISELNGGSFSQGAIISAGAAAMSIGLNELGKTAQNDGTTGVGEDADTKARADLNINEAESIFDKYPLYADAGKGASGCNQPFANCLGNCIEKSDPVNYVGKAVLTAAGGTFPRSWGGASLRAKLGSSQKLATLPSLATYAAKKTMGINLGHGLRTVGRTASPVFVGYGLYLFGMEVRCTAECLGWSCAY